MGRFREPTNPRKIGTGSFGDVYECLDTTTGRILACKKVLLEADSSGALSDKAVQSIVDEIAMMKKLSHRNIVQYVGAAKARRKTAAAETAGGGNSKNSFAGLNSPSSSPNELRIYMEYVAGGSLAQMQSKYGPLSEHIVSLYTVDILAGLAYLHENRIAHRDIKCENLLLCSSGVVKLADFGTSKQVAQEDGEAALVNTVAGTSLYMAPEVAKRMGPYDPFAADIWTVGITVLQLVTGKPPFQQFKKSPLQYLMHIAQDGVLPPIPHTTIAEGQPGEATGTPPPQGESPVGISAELADFLSHCLIREPADRWSVQQLAVHPFVLAATEQKGDSGAIPVFSPKREK